MKRDLDSVNLNIESLVVAWVRQMSKLNVFINDKVILEKEMSIQDEENEQLPASRGFNLGFSSSSLYLFEAKVIGKGVMQTFVN